MYAAARCLVTRPRRLRPDGEAIASMTWWAAVATGLALLGVIVRGDLAQAHISATGSALGGNAAADDQDTVT